MMMTNFKPVHELALASKPEHAAPEVQHAADLPNRPGSASSCETISCSASLECGCRPRQLLPHNARCVHAHAAPHTQHEGIASGVGSRDRIVKYRLDAPFWLHPVAAKTRRPK